MCTDVAARGLDIPEVDWIVQYDPPDDPKVVRFPERCYVFRGAVDLTHLRNSPMFLKLNETTNLNIFIYAYL